MTTAFGSALEHNARALSARGAWRELSVLLDDHLGEVRAQPELATLRGESFLRVGSPREGRAWFADAIPSIERRGDRAVLRRAINMLGVADFQLGELEAAGPAFERALELAQQDGDDLLVARVTNNLGMIANIRAERERALGLYALAVAAYQRIGDFVGLAQSHHNMAITFRDAGDFESADEQELRAIEFAHDAGNATLLAQARLGRAEISYRKGDARFAEAAALRAATDFAALSEPIQQADALRVVGLAALAQDKLELSARSLEDALHLACTHGGALNEAEIRHARALLFERTGDQLSMTAEARAAIALFEGLGAQHDAARLGEWLTERST